MGVWSLLAQAIMVSIAYPSAAFAAATFVTVAVMNDAGLAITGGWPEIIETTMRVLTITVATAVDALWPTAIAVAITEGFRIRAFAAYLVIGLIVGVAATVPFAALTGGAALPAFDAATLQLSAAAGAIGGFVYWLIAGRTAGHWLETDY